MSDTFEKKVLELLETINSKLDKLINSKHSGDKIPSESKSAGLSIVKPSTVVEKQKEEERKKEKPPIEGRRICPKCGGTDFNEQEDKSQVLHQQGGLRIYKKLIICKNCGYKFPT